MKQFLVLAGFALLSVGLNAQVGINNNDPKGSLDVHYTSKWAENKPQTVSFPNVSTAQRDAWEVSQLNEGMMIYNTDKRCLEMYFGVENGKAQWNCIPDTNNAQAQKVAVSAAGFVGSYIGGVPMNNENIVSFKLQNNGFSAMNNVDFSNAVSILNGTSDVQVAADQNKDVSLASGAETVLKYHLTGTPVTGTLQAKFNRVGLQTDQSTAVGLGSATISNKDNYTVSLTYNQTQIQGLINNTDHKVTIKIPYTNGKGSYNAVTNTQTSAPGQGGDTNDLTLDIPAGNFGANGEITATISVGGDGEYKVLQKKPGESYTIATFPINMNGTKYNVELKGIGGILDRCYDKYTDECVGYGAHEKEHQFIYVPIQGPDGRTWLNNNLGADYANADKPDVFNPAQQAKSYDDYHAYGSFFQWQRKADGHELMNWSSGSSAPTPKYRGAASRVGSWDANTNKFIPVESGYGPRSTWNYNYTSGPFNLWQSGGTNNPCPVGYHVPTKSEWEALDHAFHSKSSSDYRNTYVNSSLRLTSAGQHYLTAVINDQSTYGGYWSSTNSSYYNNEAWYQSFIRSSRISSGSVGHADGFSIRCLKDN